MQDMSPASHDIVAYTDQLEVSGQVSAFPPRRLLDLLNNPQTPYLIIEKASVLPLARWGESSPSTAENVVLNKSEIAFVWLVRETQVEVDEFVTVHKVPQQVIIYTGPFVAQGILHIIRERTISQALDAVREPFVALTNPSVLCLSVDRLALRGAIVCCVNKDRIMAVQASE
jgi:hypothetical protein